MKFLKTLILLFLNFSVFAQSNEVLNLSEVIANYARFKPYNTSQILNLANTDIKLLNENLKTDEQKNAFWLNIYNSFMLLNLRDTVNAGDYTKFYKLRNIEIAGRKFSLFDIEHEFLRGGVKNKSLGFKKSTFSKKDSLWKKLRPSKNDFRTIFLMYRGLYGFPPFQIVENADLNLAFSNFVSQHINVFSKNNKIVVFDWVKKYKSELKNNLVESVFAGLEIVYQKAPKAVYIDNFFPKYEKVKFDEEEPHPWLK